MAVWTSKRECFIFRFSVPHIPATAERDGGNFLFTRSFREIWGKEVQYAAVNPLLGRVSFPSYAGDEWEMNGFIRIEVEKRNWICGYIEPTPFTLLRLMVQRHRSTPETCIPSFIRIFVGGIFGLVVVVETLSFAISWLWNIIFFFWKPYKS